MLRFPKITLLATCLILLAACGAGLLPIWQIEIPQTNHQLYSSDDGASVFVLRYVENTPTLDQVDLQGQLLGSTPLLSLASLQVFARQGETLWIADDDYVDYIHRDLLTAQALDLDTAAVSLALPDSLRQPFSVFNGYLKPDQENKRLAIHGYATPQGQTEEQPIVAVIREDGSTAYELLSGDINWHTLTPMPHSSLYALYVAYSQEHFASTGTFSHIAFYDADLKPLQSFDLPQRITTTSLLPDRFHVWTDGSPRYLEISIDGSVVPSEDKSWEYRTEFLYAQEFFYSISRNSDRTTICRFDYDLQQQNCFNPQDNYWLTQAQLLPDGNLATTEQHNRISVNGAEIVPEQDVDSVLIQMRGYEESQVFYRFYSPQGELVNEIAAPHYRRYGKLSICPLNLGFICVAESESEKPGICHSSATIPLDSNALIAIETQCDHDERTDFLTFWQK